MPLFTRCALLGLCFVALPLTALASTEADADALLALRRAEARKAVADAERAELLALLPPASAKPLAGTADVGQFGAAGLARAFDLALRLADTVCAVLPSGRKTVLYEQAAAQGVLAARTVDGGMARLTDDLARQNKELQAVIDAHTPPGSQPAALSLAALAVVPATVRAAADIAALWKSDLSARGLAYGDGARALFASALARRCPERLAGLGQGYLGELDATQFDRLLARLRALATQRAEFARRIRTVEQLAAAAKGDEKRALAALAAGADDLLSEADDFIASLRAGEISERSPFYNAARYRAYAARTEGAPVLEFDLRLEGLTMVKDGLFSGQKVRLSGVAFLWYRLYEADGRLAVADAARAISAPVEIDLRADAPGADFWGVPAPRSGAGASVSTNRSTPPAIP